MRIIFETPAIGAELYQITVPAADEARVQDMTADELAEYVNEAVNDWQWIGSRVKETTGMAEDCEVQHDS